MDTMAHSLWYPQKPLVTTKGTELCGLGELPAGINVIVGVVSWSGYSQEDAIITNQGFIDRAGFRSTFWRMYTDEQKQLGNHHTEQVFEYLILFLNCVSLRNRRGKQFMD